MKKIFLGLVFISITVQAQIAEESVRSGLITYKYSNQVYVSFESTEGINKGDTLFVKNEYEYVPAIIVTDLSGSSSTGKLLIKDLTVDTRVFANIVTERKKEEKSVEKAEQKVEQMLAVTTIPIVTVANTSTVLKNEDEKIEKIEEEKPFEETEQKVEQMAEVTTVPILTGSKTSSELNSEEVEKSEINEEKSVEPVGEKVVSTTELTSVPVVLKKIQTDENTSPSFEIVSEPPAVLIEKKKEEKEELKSHVSGKISVQSYSNFTNLGRGLSYQRWRYTFQLTANNISNSKLSYTHYINFAYRASEWSETSSNLGNALRVYDLSLRYDFNNMTNLVLGRHINRKVSNVSVIDGLQFETSVSSWSFGLITGARPYYVNMGVDLKLFEYGAYVYKTDTLGFGNMQNTVSYFEQTNDSETDRRFIYLQHTNSAIQNTRIFLSSEMDLYKKELGVSKSDLSLTSIYASVNVRPSDIVSFTLSYDARKNVIYYETFKTTLDSIIENETRQGFRTRMTLKPVRNLFLGADYGYRFRKGDLKPSNNYGGYITYSQIPGIETTATLAFNKLSSSYTEGYIWSANLSRPIVYGFDIWLGYRFTNYKFRSGIEELKQNSASINLNTYLLKPVLLNFTYEGIFEKVHTSGRLLVNISYRFK